MDRSLKLLNGKKVLVTGAQGFLGRFLTTRLRESGARVVRVDARTGFDVCAPAGFKRLAARGPFDLVYHLAALMYVPFAWTQPGETNRVNIQGTLNVLEFCRQRGVRRMVYVSSYVYGHPRYLPIDERHPVAPANPYAWSKWVAEELCREYAASFGSEVVVLRPFNLYGPGQREEFLVPTLVKQARCSGSITVQNLSSKRDFLHVLDMVEALMKAGTRPLGRARTFNIGSGRSYSVRQIVRVMERILGRNLTLISSNIERPGEVRNVVADIALARRRLGWRPTVTLEDGLRSLL